MYIQLIVLHARELSHAGRTTDHNMRLVPDLDTNISKVYTRLAGGQSITVLKEH